MVFIYFLRSFFCINLPQLLLCTDRDDGNTAWMPACAYEEKWSNGTKTAYRLRRTLGRNGKVCQAIDTSTRAKIIQWPMRSRLFSLRFSMICHCTGLRLQLRHGTLSPIPLYIALNLLFQISRLNGVSPNHRCRRTGETSKWHLCAATRRVLDSNSILSTPSPSFGTRAKYAGRPLHHFSLFRNYCEVCLFVDFRFICLDRAPKPLTGRPVEILFVPFVGCAARLFGGQSDRPKNLSRIQIIASIRWTDLPDSVAWLTTRRHKLFQIFFFLPAAVATMAATVLNFFFILSAANAPNNHVKH